MLLVEGGTVTYDKKFIVDATGDARRMLENAMGLEEFYQYPSDRRWRRLDEDSEAEDSEDEAEPVETEAPVAAPTLAPVTEAPTGFPSAATVDADGFSDNANQDVGSNDATIGS